MKMLEVIVILINVFFIVLFAYLALGKEKSMSKKDKYIFGFLSLLFLVNSLMIWF